MKINYVITIPMFGTSCLLSYLFLPFFLTVAFSPPSTKSRLERLEESAKTTQDFLSRGFHTVDGAKSMYHIQKGRSDCELAEKMAIEEKDWRYEDAMICQALAYAHLGDGDRARQLLRKAIEDKRQRGHTLLADEFESTFSKQIERIEQKPPLPDTTRTGPHFVPW